MSEGLQFSTRGMMLLVGLLGFDAAVLARAYQQGRVVHSAPEYTFGFGLVLLVLNLVLFGLWRHFARARAGGWRATPSPMLIAGLYLAVMAFGILSVLFLSGRF
ncbi:hypothetical protein P12x_005703 [Tundrisphaera lichenicola]|uniref:hypothetical protein n=1 Tax=Tundrisphaera lichenicola TaxID=2029860 RepID=UPI003EBA5256